MFVLFQLLHAVKELQDRSLFVEGVSWQRVFIQENLSLKVLPTVASSLIPLNTATKEPLKKEPNLQDLTLSWVYYIFTWNFTLSIGFSYFIYF